MCIFQEVGGGDDDDGDDNADDHDDEDGCFWVAFSALYLSSFSNQRRMFVSIILVELHTYDISVTFRVGGELWVPGRISGCTVVAKSVLLATH